MLQGYAKGIKVSLDKNSVFFDSLTIWMSALLMAAIMVMPRLGSDWDMTFSFNIGAVTGISETVFPKSVFDYFFRHSVLNATTVDEIDINAQIFTI
ncbi:hypothetical protein KJ966_04620 [bacterium]|nr:hypothetical protein [bacterium]